MPEKWKEAGISVERCDEKARESQGDTRISKEKERQEQR